MSEGARWLTPEEQHTWRAFIWATQRVQEDLDRQLQRDSGMPHAYYMILVMLCEAPGRRSTMSELAERLRYSPSRLSHAVGKLEARGWVGRRRDPHCGRVTLVAITDAGYRALEEAAPAHVAQVRASVLDPLTTEEQEQLRRLCRKILAGDGEEPPGHCGPKD
jgi:DNA-binding MarR family transcriptional regulator